MQGRKLRISWIAFVAVLAAALNCGPAQGEGRARLEVSAVILSRISCGSTGVGDRRRALVSPCSSANAATTFRVRRYVGESANEAGSRRSRDRTAGTVFVSIEP